MCTVYRDLELCNVWRVRNPSALEYTWSRGKPAVIQCMLDYFLIVQCLVNFTVKCSIGPSFMSDHSIVKLKLKTQIEEEVSGN